MPILSRRTVAALAASFSLLSVLGFAVPRAAADNPATKYMEIAQALRAGGLVVVVRHARHRRAGLGSRE